MDEERGSGLVVVDGTELLMAEGAAEGREVLGDGR